MTLGHKELDVCYAFFSENLQGVALIFFYFTAEMLIKLPIKTVKLSNSQKMFYFLVCATTNLKENCSKDRKMD